MIDKWVIFGLTLSSLYSLAAVGFTLIFGVGRISNLTHGSLLMISGYVFYTLSQALGAPLYLSFLIALLASIACSILLFKGLIERVSGSEIKVVFSTLVLALTIQQIIVLVWGDYHLNIYPILSGIIKIGEVKVTSNILAILGVSWAALISLLFFVQKTNIGRAIRAVSMSREAAVIMGIDINKVNMVTWIIAGTLVGIAGIFYGSYTYLKPDVWLDPLLMSFAIVVIGGIGSIKGSLISSHIIGYIESFTMLFINERLRGVITLTILILILIFRPQGLFGEEA